MEKHCFLTKYSTCVVVNRTTIVQLYSVGSIESLRLKNDKFEHGLKFNKKSSMTAKLSGN